MAVVVQHASGSFSELPVQARELLQGEEAVPRELALRLQLPLILSRSLRNHSVKAEHILQWIDCFPSFSEAQSCWLLTL